MDKLEAELKNLPVEISEELNQNIKRNSLSLFY